MPCSHATQPNRLSSDDRHTCTQGADDPALTLPFLATIWRYRTPTRRRAAVVGRVSIAGVDPHDTQAPRFSGEFAARRASAPGTARAAVELAASERRGGVWDVTAVARMNGRAVGTASGQAAEVGALTRWMRSAGRSGWADPVWASFSSGDVVGHFQGLWVDRDSRGYGVGSELADAVVRELAARGAASIVATAAPSDLETDLGWLVKLLRGLGFEAVRSPRRPSDPQTMVARMRRDNPGRRAASVVAVERVGPSLIPWPSDKALCFHRLSRLGDGRAGHQALLAEAARGLCLRPSVIRGGPRVGISELDEAAGDGRLVFFSPCAPVGGEPSLEPEDSAREWHHRPSVAYTLESLARCGRVGWRPHDLIHAYEAAAHACRDARRRLRLAAKLGTSWSRRVVSSALSLYARHLRAAGDDAARSIVRSEAGELFAGLSAAAEASGVRDIDWLDGFQPPGALGLDAEDSWPEVLGGGPTPEVVVAGEVPLSAASYHYDAGSRVWVEGPPR